VSGALFLGIMTLISAVDFTVGWLKWRSGSARGDVGAAPAAPAADHEGRRRAGRMIMIAAPILWLIIAAICFGVFGDLGFDPILAQTL
jgi:hypothetical protein